MHSKSIINPYISVARQTLGASETVVYFMSWTMMEKSASDFGSLRVFFVVVTVALTADQNSNRVGAIPAAWHQHLHARRGNAQMPRHIALRAGAHASTHEHIPKCVPRTALS